MRRLRFLLASLLVLSSIAVPAPAADVPTGLAPVQSGDRGPLHWSGDKTLYDARENRMELIGNAAIHQAGESIYADHIIVERDTKIVHASGNAVYLGKTATLTGREMRFNLDTRTGTIHGGRVSTDQFTLSGEKIDKLGERRFRAAQAEYSTCKDCPQSWTLAAEDVDLEIEGYAYLSNVTAKVMDAPAIWIPYLVVPIKTKRQTGLLVPRFGFTNEGLTFVQPLFWAISRSFDMTLGLGVYGGRGRRAEWEGRYALENGSGRLSFFHLDDRTFREYLQTNGFTNRQGGFSGSRWGLQVEQHHELPFGFHQKLRINDVSDSLYLSKVLGDIPGNGEAYLSSDFSLSRSSDSMTAFILARRYRNILTPIEDDPRAFDSETVYVLPQVEISTNDKVFGNGWLVGGLSLGATNFVRSAGFYDHDYSDGSTPTGQFRPGRDPIRKATRFRLNPSVYSTFRVADVVSVVPRMNYKHYFYDFHDHAPVLSRGYLTFDMDISTQFEKVYPLDPSSNVPSIKHLFRPLLNYSLIPYRNNPLHPFTSQIEHARRGSFTGYNFDNEDIVPLEASFNNTNYYPPQGNALSYGFTTQIVRKRKSETSKPEAVQEYAYDRPFEWTAGQSFNFRELRKDSEDQRPLSRFYSLMTASFDRASGYFDYYYLPYQDRDLDTSRHVFSLGTSWVLERGADKLLAFERSLGLTYVFNRSSRQSQTRVLRLSSVFSLNDYIMPGAAVSYDLLRRSWQEANTTLTLQSPSECWKLDMGYYQSICPKVRPEDTGWCGTFRFNFSLNLTGEGYGGMSGPAVDPIRL